MMIVSSILSIRTSGSCIPCDRSLPPEDHFVRTHPSESQNMIIVSVNSILSSPSKMRIILNTKLVLAIVLFYPKIISSIYNSPSHIFLFTKLAMAIVPSYGVSFSSIEATHHSLPCTILSIAHLNHPDLFFYMILRQQAITEKTLDHRIVYLIMKHNLNWSSSFPPPLPNPNFNPVSVTYTYIIREKVKMQAVVKCRWIH